ncbi:MAG: nucleotidyltransferase domain-containing protein [Candidatus Shapirobacteria bacterium]|nr:nucleotidyltransferase domain-containing protein [Candidatus Shapirobacteria bacterium]MDD4383035.1 nucleotidyltransferase domain-containing protein [Candidatus Shapirobacteria bacterium]
MDVFQSIQETIKYAQKYGGRLTEKQLFERLIGDRVYKKKEIDQIIKLLNYKVVKLEEKNNILEEKIEKAKRLAKKISRNFKDILFLGITGSVAAGYPKKNNDIDLIIITKINKLWLIRLKLRLFIMVNKIPHRKFGKKEKTDEFCFNLWLDEKSLELDKEKQHLKNAVDLILMKPLINKNKTYEKFILANDWAKKYIATGYSLKKPSPPINRGTSLDREALSERIINWLMFWLQFLYMKKKIKNEKVGLHKAFFHH